MTRRRDTDQNECERHDDIFEFIVSQVEDLITFIGLGFISAFYVK